MCLAGRQKQVTFEVGGEAGKRIPSYFGLSASADTLLFMIRNTPERTQFSPWLLGVDDFAQNLLTEYYISNLALVVC